MRGGDGNDDAAEGDTRPGSIEFDPDSSASIIDDALVEFFSRTWEEEWDVDDGTASR